MENEKKNINWLKSSLYNTVKEFDEKYLEKENIIFKYSILSNISRILDSGEIKSNLFELNEQLLIIYGKENGQRIINQLGTILYGMKIYLSKSSKEALYMDEYNKLVQKLDSFKEMINKEKIMAIKEKEQIDSKYPSELYKKYRFIISSFKYDQIIDSKVLQTIKEYLNQKELTDIEQIQLLEYIRLNNSRISRDRGVRHSGALDGKEVLGMLNLGFINYERPYIDSVIKSKKIYSESLAYLNTILNADSVEEVLDSLDLSQYSYAEKQRLVVNIINGIQDKLLEVKELIESKDFYLDVSIRDEIINDYRNLSKKYKLMDAYYNDLEKDIVIPPNAKPKNILLFLEPASSEQDKTYFEKDLEKIPREFLPIFSKLMESFIYDISKKVVDSFKNDKSDKYKRFFKLKDSGHRTNRGKSRIVCRQIKDNCYLVLGALVKKSFSADMEYDSIINRYRDIEITPQLIKENEENLNRILNYMEQNKIEPRNSNNESGKQR